MRSTIEVLARIERLRVLPVIIIDDAACAVSLADALLRGGLPIAEVTLRTPAAAEAIRRIHAERPEVLVGAGTVLTAAQVQQARRAGASFVVSPGFNPGVVDACRAEGLPVFPGICTPTEIEAAIEHGCDVLKFFPAEAMGGVGFLKAVSAPYRGIRFIPTGGITAANLDAYLALPNVVACGGSWMCSSDAIRTRQFAEIRATVAEAVSLAGVHPLVAARAALA